MTEIQQWQPHRLCRILRVPGTSWLLKHAESEDGVNGCYSTIHLLAVTVTCLHSGVTAGDQSVYDGIPFTDVSMKNNTVKTLAQLDCNKQLTDGKVISLDNYGLFLATDSGWQVPRHGVALCLWIDKHTHASVGRWCTDESNHFQFSESSSCSASTTFIVIVDDRAFLHHVQWLKHAQEIVDWVKFQYYMQTFSVNLCIKWCYIINCFLCIL